jgi:dTMP kinase
LLSGLFISFEGPDGSGKTTQVAALAEALRARGYDVLVTREPGGTPISDKVRALILDPEHQEMKDETEILLYAASRAQHVREKIRPALQEGKIVLCDRYLDASVAYQGYGLGQPIEDILAINHFATGGLMPDRTYMLMVPVQVGRQRLKNRSGLDRIEQKGEAYHEKVMEGFLKLADLFPDRIRVIQADREQNAVHQEILSDFLKWIHE